MKIILLCVGMLLLRLVITAQNLYEVEAGTNLFIKSGTVFTAGDLTLTPTSNFTLTNVSFAKSGSTVHTTASPYVNEVYQFSNTTSPYSGTIRFGYDDDLLNGLFEILLTINIHNGTSWTAYSTSALSWVSNYITSYPVTNVKLNEFALGNIFYALPLKWTEVKASRKGKEVLISWKVEDELNVRHYSVERQVQGGRWETIIDSIAVKSQYTAIDKNYNAGKLLYRIRESDIDGKFSYSTVVAVNAVEEKPAITLYPNPCSNSFKLTGSNFKQLLIVDASGSLVKTFASPQSEYNVSDITAGRYIICVISQDGNISYLKLIKN